MTPSQKNEDLKAFEAWLNYSYSECSDFNEVKFGNAKIPYKVSWFAALKYERERVKREEPTFSEVLAALRSKECGDGIFDTVVAFLEEHFKTSPRPKPAPQDDERDADEASEPYVSGLKNQNENQKGWSMIDFIAGFLEGRRSCACRNLTKEKT